MMRAAGIAFAGLLAAALHLAAFAAVAPRLRGVQSAGTGGSAPVTLAAADPVLAALVADWDRPPAADPASPVPPARTSPVQILPSPVSPPPVPPAPEQAPALIAADPAARLALVPLATPSPDPAPSRDRDPPQPEPDPKPESKPEPKPESKPAAAAREKAAPQPAAPAQQAAGANGSQAAGTSGTANAAKAGQGQAGAMAEWGAAIRARIERRKSYPVEAKGKAGKVTLRLVVGPDGRLSSVAVAKSSGSAALDAAALRAVKVAGRFPRAPAGLGTGSFSLPITFAP